MWSGAFSRMWHRRRQVEVLVSRHIVRCLEIISIRRCRRRRSRNSGIAFRTIGHRRCVPLMFFTVDMRQVLRFLDVDVDLSTKITHFCHRRRGRNATLSYVANGAHDRSMVAIARYVDIEQSIGIFTGLFEVCNLISIHTVRNFLRCIIEQFNHVFIDSNNGLSIECRDFLQKPIGLEFQFLRLHSDRRTKNITY